jgi:hypothetical protein
MAAGRGHGRRGFGDFVFGATVDGEKKLAGCLEIFIGNAEVPFLRCEVSE